MGKKCKKEVWHGCRPHHCDKKALPGSDYCGIHELDLLRAENAALRERVAVLERVREAADIACRQYSGKRGPVLVPMEVLNRLLNEADDLAAAKPAAQEGKEASDG